MFDGSLAWQMVNGETLKRAPWRVQVAHRVHEARDSVSRPHLFFKAGSGWLLRQQEGAWLVFNETGSLVAVAPPGKLSFEHPGDRDWF